MAGLDRRSFFLPIWYGLRQGRGVDSYGTFAPPYEGGRYFVGTNRVTSADMWFRTGVRPPGTRLAFEHDGVLRWEGISPLTYSVWASNSLTNWTHLDFVQSHTKDYAFTNNASGPGMRFFKVSVP
jgi:hypothetical protein